jgi:PAP2 superfamily
VCFTAFRVTASHLRADTAQLRAAGPSHWVVSAIYSLDPPYNLFPSLHVCITALAAISVWKADRRYGAVLFLGLGQVAISVCTTKQHFLLDVLGGLALAALVGGIVLGPIVGTALQRPTLGAGRKLSWVSCTHACGILRRLSLSFAPSRIMMHVVAASIHSTRLGFSLWARAIARFAPGVSPLRISARPKS